MHRTGELFGHYQTLEQQKDSATLGMWIFLATEVLFFGGLFLTYTINRHTYPLAFSLGSNTLDIYLGTINTAVLIISSLTMAMAVWCAETDRKKMMPVYLMLTIILGCAFLGIKFVEYKQKFDHHLVPGYNFDIRYHTEGPEGAAELKRAFQQDPGLNSHAQLYFSLYFGMTGLHAMHMIVGVGLVFWLFLQSLKGRFGSRYANPVENIGLYWHFVDIVWIYLYPLLYLIDRHLK